MKLYYFDIYGRAEAIRMILNHKKEPFENVLIDGAKLQELKASGVLEFGQVPMLQTDDGKQLVQSWAILRYLGRRFGYYPDDAETAWRVDSTIDAVEDFFTSYFRVHFEGDETKKEAAKAKFLSDFLPKWLDAIEKRIKNNENPNYIVGGKITIADFALAAAAFNLLLNEANPLYKDFEPIVGKYEVLKAYATHLKGELAEHLTNRNQPRPI